MRTRSIAFFCALLCPLATYAQGTSQAAPCTIQAPPPVSDADKAFASGNFAQAESLYAATTPATTASFSGLVNSQLEQNKLPEAAASAQKAAAALPASADAQSLTGIALLRAGQISEASAVFTKAYGIDRCSPLTLFGLSKVNRLTSRHLAASRELEAAHHDAPWNSMITVEWLNFLALDVRGPAIHAFLESKPLLPPAALQRLVTQAAIADQHLTCKPAAIPKTPVTLDINSLMLYGTRARSFGLKTKIGNADPLLELDSSVDGIILSPGDAKKAGVHPLTSGSPTLDASYYAVADHVRIGPIEFQNCPIRVVPAVALGNANSLIGTNFLGDFRISIDFVNRHVTLTPYADNPDTLTDRTVPPDEHDYSPAYIAGSDILIPTTVNKHGPYLFLLDTGTYESLISPLIDSQLFLSMHAKTANIHGSSGAIIKAFPKYGGPGISMDEAEVTGPDGKLLHVVSPIKVPTFRFTNNEFYEEHVLSFDITPKSHNTGVEIGGLIGFSTLREFYLDLDYRNGLVRLTYDDKHLYMSREVDRSGRPE